MFVDSELVVLRLKKLRRVKFHRIKGRVRNPVVRTADLCLLLVWDQDLLMRLRTMRDSNKNDLVFLLRVDLHLVQVRDQEFTLLIILLLLANILCNINLPKLKNCPKLTLLHVTYQKNKPLIYYPDTIKDLELSHSNIDLEVDVFLPHVHRYITCQESKPLNYYTTKDLELSPSNRDLVDLEVDVFLLLVSKGLTSSLVGDHVLL